MFRIGTVLVVAGLLRAGAGAAEAPAYTITVPRLATQPNMGGELDGSWSRAVSVSADFNFFSGRSGEATDVRVVQDPGGLDVAFVVTQAVPLTAEQRTNGSAIVNDDHVTVALWPQGASGFGYTFSANARGAMYQTSTENTAYTPRWTSAAHVTPTGYTVVLRIPFNVLRTGASPVWRAQFDRTTIQTNSTQVWAHFTNQRSPEDAPFSGTLSGIVLPRRASTPQPRVDLYALHQIAQPAQGGDTSRTGLDLSYPVTPTSSIVATFHPDYSNVERDQQTIAPTAFPRQQSEVRPFFTQAAANVNPYFSCNNCPLTLYTPFIPTFREGYAFEGIAGALKFALLDAVGSGRTDSAEAVQLSLNNARYGYTAGLQRVAVDEPGFIDQALTFSTGYLNKHSRAFVYANAGWDRGTNVTDPGQANYVEYGGGYSKRYTTATISFQKIGAQFAPADGYVAQNDIAGYSFDFSHSLYNDPKGRLTDLRVTADYGRFRGSSGQLAQTNADASVKADFRNLFELKLFGNADSVLTTDGERAPFSTNGLYLGYRSNTTKPSYISYSGGAYYHGVLRSWTYFATIPVARTISTTFELDENTYRSRLGTEPQARQWLERATLDWQFSRYASLDVGVRKIVGRNLPNAYQTPDRTPGCGALNGPSPFDCVYASNVSAAFHFLAAHNEFYAVYGDPNSLLTRRAVYLKWVRYVGGDKGT